MVEVGAIGHVTFDDNPPISHKSTSTWKLVYVALQATRLYTVSLFPHSYWIPSYLQYCDELLHPACKHTMAYYCGHLKPIPQFRLVCCSHAECNNSSVPSIRYPPPILDWHSSIQYERFGCKPAISTKWAIVNLICNPLKILHLSVLTAAASKFPSQVTLLEQWVCIGSLNGQITHGG